MIFCISQAGMGADGILEERVHGSASQDHEPLLRPIILLPLNDGFGNSIELCETQIDIPR
jgi:hypothetical protein